MSALALAIPAVAARQSIMNRGASREGTDLLDDVRLCLDPLVGSAVRAQLAGAGAQLRADAARHTERWFHGHAARSLRLVRAIPEGRESQLDDLQLVGELLMGSLTDRSR